MAEIHEDFRGWRGAGMDIVRGIAAGSIVGIPLLYTMEIWQSGKVLPEWHILVILLATLITNWVICRVIGFRPVYTLWSALGESATSMAIGFAYALVVLWLLGEITADISFIEIISMTVVATAAVSIGVSFANSQVREKAMEERRRDKDSENSDEDLERMQWHDDLRDAGGTLAGSLVMALPIASTEEIPRIVTQIGPPRILAILLFSVVLCHLMLFASHFRYRRVYRETLFQSKTAEVVLTCGLALCVSAALTALIGSSTGSNGYSMFVERTVALGLPAIAGGAAGRLLL